MITKIGDAYVMDEVWKPTVTKYALKESERMTLGVAGYGYFNRGCGNCGMPFETGGAVIRADSGHVLICDDCAAKYCPDLLSEAIRWRDEYDEMLRAEEAAREREWGPTGVRAFGNKPDGNELSGQPEKKKCSPTDGESDDEGRRPRGRY